MALTDEQMAQMTAEQLAQIDTDMREHRAKAEAQLQVHYAENLRQRRLEALRTAQAVAFENRRLLPAGDAQAITTADLVAMADEIMTFVHAAD